LVSIAVATPVVAGQQAQRTVRSPATPNLPAQPVEASSQSSTVTFKEGRLSANIQNRSLESLAEEVSAKAGVDIILCGDVGSQTVSLNFRNLPLDQGLRRILDKYDAFFFYGVEKQEPSSLKSVWVYPMREGRGIAPVPPESWGSTKELEPMLADPDPKVRARAIAALVGRKGEAALDAVLEALRDSDDQVRTEALYGAAKAGVDLPEESLRDLALNDASADVRFLALQSLANSPDAGSVAEMALNDSSEPVRGEAQEILRRLSGKRSPRPGQTAPDLQQPPNQ
jgi:hypothetical protein